MVEATEPHASVWLTYMATSLIALPDIASRFSEAETVVLLAYDRAATERKWYRAFIAKRDYDQF
jgi:hypothetical protein